MKLHQYQFKKWKKSFVNWLKGNIFFIKDSYEQEGKVKKKFKGDIGN